MSLAEDFRMTSIPCNYMVFQLLLLSGLITPAAGLAGLLPEEKPLWPDADWQNPIQYDVPEAARQQDPAKTSPSGSNRVYSFVSRPTYSIHQPTEAPANGVGLVICPGGGFRELWLDREGHDLALWLKDRGFTSLVLKYRTNNELENGKRKYPPEVYEPAVVSDARQAIRILRSQAAALHLDPKRIGICGFSAGGALSAYTVFRPEAAEKQPVSGQPDFAGLFYPGLREMTPEAVASAKQIPPLFIVNAIDDRLTPVDRCVDFYQSLLKAGAHAELHLYNKGGHGFDIGVGHGQSVGLWKESFLAWLKDSGFIE
jgi:acetyl esterase/lipase